MNNNEIIVGTRGSKLALIQTRIVTNNLLKINPDLKFKIQIIKTTGDKGNINTPGAFSGDIEKVLLEKKIDMAVHSFKDMPSVSTPGLKFSALLKREEANDVLVLKNMTAFNPGKNYIIGTGSPRRALLLKYYYPHFSVVPIRGNVDTRISIADSGKMDGVILALAGLKRLGIVDRVSLLLSLDKFIPAPGQGILAVQTRENDLEMIDIVHPLDDPETRLCAKAERLILQEISAGCSVALGAYARCLGRNQIELRAFYGLNEIGKLNFESITFDKTDIENYSINIAALLKQKYRP